MKLKTKIIIIIVLVLVLVITIGVVLIIKNISADVNTIVSCQRDAQCEDGYAITQDKCHNPKTTRAYCTHSAKRPIGYAYGFNSYDFQDYQSCFNDWSQSGLFDSVDVINGRLDLTQTGPNSQKALFDDLKSKGKIFSYRLSYYGWEAVKDSITAQKMAADMSEYSYIHGFDAIAFDELVIRDGDNTYLHLMETFSFALEILKKQYPKKLIFVMGVSNIPTDVNKKNIFKRVLTYSDFYTPEYYIDENQSNNMPTLENLGQIDNKFKTEFQSDIPDIGSKILLGLGAADTEYITYDTNPQIDFKKFLDKEVHLVKEHSVQGLNKGVMIYSSGRSNFETNAWLAKLFNHYFVRNQNNLFSSSDYVLPHLKNPGFENVEDDAPRYWTIHRGAYGEVKSVDYSNLSPKLYKFGYLSGLEGKVPQGERVLRMKKGNNVDSYNRVEQEITGLEPGKEYYLEIYSKKHSGDYGESSIKTLLRNSSDNSAILARYSRKTLCMAALGWSYGISREQCDHTDLKLPDGTHAPNSSKFWVREIYHFTAPAFPVKVVFNDKRAPVGEVNLVDFVQLQPDTLPSQSDKNYETD